MVMNGRIRLINYKYLLTCIQVKSHSKILLSRMVIIHAVQKLLNTSRLKPSLFVSQPLEGEELHSWCDLSKRSIKTTNSYFIFAV